MVFFGRLAYKFANTLARGFAVVLLVGATVFRRRFRRYLQRLSALLLRRCSVLATVRYYFDLLMFFAVCLLNIYLLTFDTGYSLGE